jgi:tetratricopeptide (TPR) repeat protein
LNNLGSVAAKQGDDETAVSLYVESLEMARDDGDLRSMVTGLQNLGWLDLKAGRLADAAARYDECLTIVDHFENRWTYAALLAGIGLIALERSDLPEAQRLLRDGLSIHHELGDLPQLGSFLGWLACIAVANGQPLRAARWFGAAEVVRARINDDLDPYAASLHERHIRVGLTQVDADRWAAAWAEGRAIPLDAAVREALDVDPTHPVPRA